MGHISDGGGGGLNYSGDGGEGSGLARSLARSSPLDRFSFEHDPTSLGSLLTSYSPVGRSVTGLLIAKMRPAAIAGYAFGFSDGKLNGEPDR